MISIKTVIAATLIAFSTMAVTTPAMAYSKKGSSYSKKSSSDKPYKAKAKKSSYKKF